LLFDSALLDIAPDEVQSSVRQELGMQLQKFRSVAAGIVLLAVAGCQTTDKPAPQTNENPAPRPADNAAAQPGAAAALAAARPPAQTAAARPLPIRATAGDIARPGKPRALAEIEAAARALPTTRDGVYAALDEARAQRGDGDAGLVAMRYTLLGRSGDALNWMRDGSSDLVFLYAETMWSISNSLRNTPGGAATAETLAESSVTMTLLGYVLLLVDGARCVDTTGAGGRLDKMLPRAARFKAFADLPAERRNLIRTTALDVERRTAAARRDDPSICMDGIREMGRMMESRGSTQTQRPGAPTGHYGTVVEIGASPDYIPQYLPPAQQAEAMAKARPIAAKFVAELLP
jgi:hypothetical protein